MNTIKHSAISAVRNLIGGYTTMKVTELHPKTRRFPAHELATVVKSTACNLDDFRSLLVLPDNQFVIGQIKNIRCFGEVLSSDQLEAKVRACSSDDQFGALHDHDGLKKAYDLYQPFLWLRFSTRQEGQQVVGRFLLINPVSGEELFVVEKQFDYSSSLWVSDQTTWYPMFNALIDYIEENAVSWSKLRAVA